MKKATLGLQEILAALDPGEMAASLGIDQSWVENLGIREFSEVILLHIAPKLLLLMMMMMAISINGFP